MLRIRKFAVPFVLSVILVVTASWGFLVHKTVHQLAVYELPKEMVPFFYQNMDYLVTNAPRPDMRRNQDSTEATKHFIDLEMYGEQAATKMPMDWQAAQKIYTKDSLLKYGYVPYHVVYMKGKLTEAFRKGNKDSILFYAADLGHYIGDANVPLHTSVNYDGQLTDQKGLHSLWESMIPEILIGNYNLYSDHKAAYLKDPAVTIWGAIRRAADLVPDMLSKEKEVSKNFTPEQKFRTQIRNGRESKSYTSEFAKAYAAALKNTINEQLINSANLVADFWYTSWVDAGKPDLSVLTPGWSADSQSKLGNELQAFKNNKLLESNLLLSKRPETRVPNP
ncbi:MAG: zinc dependent phospholipase C family protein [Bacteroidota bacterium]